MFKAVLKSIAFVVLYFTISFILNIITNWIPWITPFLLIIAIIGLILTFYFENKE